MSFEATALIMFAVMMGLFILGIPIAWALSASALGVAFFLWGFQSLFILITTTYGSMINEVFIALPLFIFMGVILERSGIADSLYQTMYVWSGRLRGGLAMASVFVCMIFAAMTGLTGAACVTMGLIALPAMLKRGYSKDLALGSVLAPSTLGILIPPSVFMILLGVIGQISIGKLFMAGMVPGLLMAFLFVLYIGIVGWLQPETCPAISERYSFKRKVILSKELVLPLVVVVVVLGSIFAGIATPTESAGVGAAGLVVATAVRRELSWELIWATSTETFRITAFNMWIIFGAMTWGALYIGLGGIEVVRGLLVHPEMSPWVTYTIVMVLTFIMGMFIDPFAIIWIVGPLSFPIIKELGFNPIWYGVLFVINICTSYITPPFGANLFFMKAIAPPGITTRDIFHSIWPFLGVMLVTIVLVTVFSGIALWLPSEMIVRGG